MNQRALRFFTEFLPFGLGFSGGHWRWRKRTPIALSSCERKTPYVLMGLSDFDGDGEREMATAKYYLLRGWWQTHGRSAKGGRIWKTRNVNIPDQTFRSSRMIWTGRRTVGAKTLSCWLGRTWYWEITSLRGMKEGVIEKNENLMVWVLAGKYPVWYVEVEK